MTPLFREQSLEGRVGQLTGPSLAELVIVSTSSDGAPDGSEDPQDDSYDKQDHSQAPEDGNPKEEPEKKKNYTKSDHGYLLSRYLRLLQRLSPNSPILKKCACNTQLKTL